MRKYLVAIFNILSITPAMANDVDLGNARDRRRGGRSSKSIVVSLCSFDGCTILRQTKVKARLLTGLLVGVRIQ